MPVPNTFANATATIPLSQLDANFATTITLGNTAIQLGNTVSTLNNMTLANVTVTSGNVTITNVTVTTANVTTANIATAVITTANIATSNVTTSQILNYGTADQVQYLDANKALTGSANLTFSGTTLTVNSVGVGRGAGNVATNTTVGSGALAANTSGTQNNAFGNLALASVTTNGFNDAFGYSTLQFNTGAANAGFGNSAMRGVNGSSTGSFNSAVGAAALLGLTTGSYNTAVGSDSLRSNTTASNNTAVGYQAGYSNTTGARLSAFGFQAAYYNTTGADVTAIGAYALTQNTTGNNNTAVGREALQANTTASNNTAVGYQAGYSQISTASDQVFLGYRAGYSSTSGYNVMVGSQAGYNSTGAGNTFVGGNSSSGFGAGYAMTTGVQNTILGGFSGNQGGLDIRTASNRIVLSDGAGNPRMNCTPNSDWEITPGESGSSTGVYPGIYLSYGAGVSGAAGEASLVNNLYYASGSYRFLKTSGFTGGVVAINASGAITGRAATNTSSAGAAATMVDLFGVSAGNTFYLQGATGSSGTGIAFPATQNASTNANTLDDYEEGTWTPGIAGGSGTTYTTRVGWYTKVGNLVTVGFDLNLNAKGTIAGNAQITGLPFTTGNRGGSAFAVANNTGTAYVYTAGFIDSTSTAIDIYIKTAAATSTTVPTGTAFFAANTQLIASFSYRV